MIGRLYIDGHDAYKVYGAYVTESGWNALVAMPPLKTLESNDWQEEDGIEVDASAPVLNTRDVSITFAFGGVFNRYYAFVDMLSDGAYHEFNCAYIGRTFKLRLVQADNLDIAKLLGKAQFKFADDFPMRDYKAYVAPSSTIAASDDYTIDGRNFSDYGARVLKGTFSEVVKTAAVKTALLRNIGTQAGAIYDDENVVFKTKDVKLSILMRGKTLSELWQNYDALLYDLIRPDERSLWCNELEQEFPCVYKQCSVSNFYPEDVWLEFTLTLTFTRDFRITEDDLVLASESNIVIYTENDVYAIDMLPDRFSYPTLRLVNNRATLRLTAIGALRFND